LRHARIHQRRTDSRNQAATVLNHGGQEVLPGTSHPSDQTASGQHRDHEELSTTISNAPIQIARELSNLPNEPEDSTYRRSYLGSSPVPVQRHDKANSPGISANLDATSCNPGNLDFPENTDAVGRGTTASLGQEAYNDIFLRPPNSDLEYLPAGDLAFAGPDFEFDSTNWLLEDSFLDILEPKSPRSMPGQVYPVLESNPIPSVRDLRDIWYVQVWKPDQGHATAFDMTIPRQGNSLREDIDETYRANMATDLSPPVRNDPLPSIDLLASQFLT
jgi:hypothetical protein